jgi:SAM-dependent methyltransferase
MATSSTVEFFKQKEKLLRPPFLEIGSLIMPEYIQYSPKSMQTVSATDEYVGIDIFEGEGVDRVFDLAKAELADLADWKEKFSTIHIHYIMEHVIDIFKMARNIDYITKPGGVLCFSAPFSWKIHRIPVDMWRFTPQSVDYLFSQFQFLPEHAAWSTRGNQTFAIDHRQEIAFGTELNKHNFFLRMAIKWLRKLKKDEGFFSERALLHETNLMMMGIKQGKPTYTFLEEKYL